MHEKTEPIVDSADLSSSHSPRGAESEEFVGGLSPPQFGMRQLFLFMLVVALLLVAVKSLDPLLSFTLVLLALSIFAHVAGNAIGTKLRDQRKEIAPPKGTTRKAEARDFAPATQLSERKPLGWVMKILTTLGAVVGGTAGGWFLANQAGDKATIANVTLAVLSCGVLGGFFGFWMSSFLQIALTAVWQAHREADPPLRQR